MLITDVCAIYQYQTARLAWENIGPRKMHFLAYQVVGRYDHSINGNIYSARKDNLLFINQADSYTVKCYEQGYCFCVSFYAETDMPTTVWDMGNNPIVKNLFLRLMGIKNLSNKHNYYLALSILYEIMSIITSPKTPNPTNSPSDSVELAAQYITEHLTDNNLNTAKLAELCCISEKYFRTLFKKRYNTTPTQYIIHLRLNTAAKLLHIGGFTVAEIATMVGIPDVYYFSKLFKKHFGVSPSKYQPNI